MTRHAKITLWTLALLLPALGLLTPPKLAQGQALPLPADLFILNETGQVMRIAVGSSFAAPVTPPDQTAADFGVAPDGQWIAYRTMGSADGSVAAFLAVTSLDGQSGQLLEFQSAGQPPITGRGQTLAWSPDGTVIAYTTADGLRFYLAGLGETGAPLFQDHTGGPFLNLVWSPGGGFLAAEMESNVWNIYRRESTAGMVYAGQIPASAGLAWTQEGVLALAPPGGGLILLSLLDGSQIALLEPPTVVSQPALVDGSRLTFLVHEESGQRFAARRFGTVSVIGGDFQAFEASLELTGAMRWLPDGRALLSLEGGTLTLIEPRTDTRREIISGVKSYGWGPLPPLELTGAILPADLYFLSRDEAGVAQLWRLPADGSPAAQLTVEARSVLDFTLSPDGRQIAYTAGGSLVAANSDGSAGRELSPVVNRPGAGAQPAWSPNGALIAFARDGIWVVPATGGARTELITDRLGQDTPPDQVRVYMRPRWSRDNTLLLVSIGYYEGAGLGILPITGGEALPLPVSATEGAWLPNGQILAWASGFASATPGLYLVNPANLSEAVTVLGDTWSISDAVPLANEAAVILHSPGSDAVGPGTAQPFLVPILPNALPIPNGQGGLIEAPTLSPDGTFAAGLRAAAYGDFGLAGRLVLINLRSGERTAIQTPGEVWGLQWGRTTQP
jgi:WD40 repeat protein